MLALPPESSKHPRYTCLDLKWKQRIKVTCPHEMIDIESVSGPNRDFRRRERKGGDSRL